MTNENNKKRAEELRKKADEAMQRRDESFERSDTDGFLTQWACGLTASQYRAQADIEERGGVSDFSGLFDLEGNRVPAVLIEGKFGLCWALCDKETGKFTGQFVNHPGSEPTARQAKNLAKKGYKIQIETAPAKAVLKGSGTGLGGTAWVAVIRTDGGYPGRPSNNDD